MPFETIAIFCFLFHEKGEKDWQKEAKVGKGNSSFPDEGIMRTVHTHPTARRHQLAYLLYARKGQGECKSQLDFVQQGHLRGKGSHYCNCDRIGRTKRSRRVVED